MEYINLDKWRVLNESLFRAYIYCYDLLSNDQESVPAKAMVRSLKEYDILLSVTESDYAAVYIIARELGIYYQNVQDKFVLSELAKKFRDGDLSYSDYLKHYVLNSEFLINGEIVHAFEEISQSLQGGPLTINELSNSCVKCIPVSKRSVNATEKLKIFLRRAIDAQLVNLIDGRYSLAKPFDLIIQSISKSNLSVSEFESEFIGTGIGKQENIVNRMIGRVIPPQIYDGNASGPFGQRPGPGSNDKFPLNQILYGPPGTGKTYASITKALDIINILYSDYQDAEEKFRNELGKRIEFVTMHQSFSYEDFIQGLKPEFDESVNVLKFRYKDGVFKQICERASNCVNGDDADEPSVTLSNTEVLTIAFYLSKFNGKRKIEKKANDFLKYKSDNQAFFDIGKKIGHNHLSLKNHRDKFDFMFNDRDGYTARTGWVPRNKDGVLDNSTIWPYKDVYDQLNGKSFDELSVEVNQLLSKKGDASYTREGNCNHVIILDEINRANISRVFGELIALIETEKRGGRLTCTLPSGDRFTVPSNLYVIGTMNTADKSIALVDIALRRRFRFIPLYPDLAILEDELKRQNTDADEINTRKYLLENLNKIIRGRKSVDFEIGHSYFLKKDLTIKDILNEQIIPLMNEYFLNNTTSIKNILEDKVIGITCDRQILESRGLLYVSSDYVIPPGL